MNNFVVLATLDRDQMLDIVSVYPRNHRLPLAHRAFKMFFEDWCNQNVKGSLWVEPEMADTGPLVDQAITLMFSEAEDAVLFRMFHP